MKWLEWRLKRMVLHLTPVPLVLALIVLAALAVWLGGVLPLERQAAGARALALRPVPVQTPVVKVDPTRARQEELAAFDQMFPSADNLSAQLGTLFEIVERNGLAIDEGQYKLTERPGKLLRRFEAEFPVHGSYAQIRRMLDEALKALPAMALDEVTMAREKIADGKLDAQLRFVFFVKRQP